MKTLKQQLRNRMTLKNQNYMPYTLEEEAVINAVKEWLTQKRQMIGNKELDTTENAIIDRLLEELNHEP